MARDRQGTASRWTRYELVWALVVLGYFVVQMLLRMRFGRALELDEAEALVHARELRWGYGAQPPLYFWLQWGMFRLLGETVLALAALKALLLTGVLIGVHVLLRREWPPVTAGVGALSLSLLPQVMWESQRALTHSVLALLMAVVMAACALRALERGGMGSYRLLGLAVGLGVLSKFNVAVWALGLLGAAVMLPEWRARLRIGGVAAAIGVAATVVAPVAVWMRANPDLSTQSVEKFGIETGAIAARAQGLLDLLVAGLGFLALVILVVLSALLLRARPARRLPPATQFLAVAAGLSILAVVALVLATGMTEMKDRWLLPFAWPLAPVAVLVFWPGLGRRGRGALGGFVAGLWLLVAAALPFANLSGYRGMDWEPLATRLNALGPPEQPILVADQFAAGNLILAAPELSPVFLMSPEALPSGRSILVAEEGSDWWAAPDVAGRVEGREIVEVRRGGRIFRFVVARLG
ncbi:ArnT family glycosyltransferase [Rubellimicrobium roseum]|uniref:Glycosyltransferase RgtA/B/C/D-like domain-containing protein n=1 Tax=Rubellimicrobium roseum TaxID=687525 RepID=A0A5C4N845_9RHOB|nr:glycosyltransferase family 39 protein [Rubellimicrobium roseum]TNC67578.1 hypothetical protein FHG71_15385 [Rubellimicrobium roseum]